MNDMTTKTTHSDIDFKEDSPDAKGLVRLYYLVIIGLLVGILATGIAITWQTQKHHQTYQELQRLKQEMDKMQIEKQRLLIEQQTFSAIPQVADKATGDLGMFYPTNNQKEVVVSKPHSLSPAGDAP